MHKRELGFFSATSIVVASMIGSGVFTTSGFLIADLKSSWLVIIVWFIGGIIALLGAVSYSALARLIPESGGEYIFLSKTLHPSAGYIAGWISLFVGFSAPLAAAACAFGKYFKLWLPYEIPDKFYGTAVIIIFFIIHAIGVKYGAIVQNLVVCIKLLFILFGITVAVNRIEISEVSFGQLDLSAFAVSLIWVSYSYSGWNAAVYVGGEVSKPEKNLFWSLIIGTFVVMVIYVFINAVFVFSAPINELAGVLEIGLVAANRLAGDAGMKVVSVIVSLALLTSASSLTMAGPRVIAKMAEDGYLPSIFSGKEGPPRWAMALQSTIALVMLWTATYDALLTYIGFTLALSTAAAVIGLGLVKVKNRNLFVPGWPWVQVLFLIFVFWSCFFAIFRRPAESMAGLLTIGLGYIIWYLKVKTH